MTGDGAIRIAATPAHAAFGETGDRATGRIRCRTATIRPRTVAVRPATTTIRSRTPAVRSRTRTIRPATETVRSRTPGVRPATAAVRLRTPSVRPPRIVVACRVGRKLLTMNGGRCWSPPCGPEGAPGCRHGCSGGALTAAEPVDSEGSTPPPQRGGGDVGAGAMNDREDSFAPPGRSRSHERTPRVPRRSKPRRSTRGYNPEPLPGLKATEQMPPPHLIALRILGCGFIAAF